MSDTFLKKAVKKGKYFDALTVAIGRIRNTYLNVTGKNERNFEDRIATSLSSAFSMPPNKDAELKFIDQRDKQETLTRVTLFNCDHRPDMSIGRDGIAVEVKRVRHGSAIRNGIGQCITYRHGYRFVILVAVDESAKDKPIKALFNDPTTAETRLTEFLEEMGIYVIVA